MEPGICYIKKDYLISDCDSGSSTDANGKRKLSDENTTEAGDNNHSPKYKKVDKKNRKRGQNKNRPVYKDDRLSHLCHTLVNGPNPKEPCKHPNCRYVHDLDQYMSTKGEDIGEKCPIYESRGFCVRGVTCRFAKSHLDADGRNMKAEHFEESSNQATSISTELQVQLRKRDYNFKKSQDLVEHFEKQRQLHVKEKAEENSQEKPIADKMETVSTTEEKPIGSAVDDECIQGRDKCQKSPIDFSNKVILSPLTTVGNLPFRRICKEFGADITCGEMACAVPLLKGLTQEWALTKRHESEDIFGVQLCGNNARVISQAAQLIQETKKVDFLDLNIGCPIELIYQQGGGAALMRRTNILETTIRTCSMLSPQIPFTVKMRTGVYADKSVADKLIPLVEEWGAAAVTLHGRSREQRYTRSANWEYIEECAAKAKHMPIIGNGDILSYVDYNEKKKIAPHVSSVMIGRGALIKPWIFKEIKEQQHWDPTSSERFEIIRKFVNYGLDHWGSDTKGVETTRRFLLEWQSFLYRYIPYDLLEYPPQQINQRPQNFRGRDEMETLMSSPNSKDWVKLSEMLLGPVPDGYTFVPKHKANAY